MRVWALMSGYALECGQGHACPLRVVVGDREQPTFTSEGQFTNLRLCEVREQRPVSGYAQRHVAGGFRDQGLHASTFLG